MPQLDLTDQEVTNLVNILAQTTAFPWIVTNPLLVKLMPLLQRSRSANGQPIESAAVPHPYFRAQRGTTGDE